MSTVNFDDINQTVFYIPYAGPDSEDDENGPTVPLPEPRFKERDLADGAQLRLKAYRAAWDKCLSRVQAILKSLHAPVVAAVAQEVQKSYSEVLPGLPYPELPVVCISNPSTSSTFLSEATSRLERANHTNGSAVQDASSFTTHLYPTDFPNVMTGMKSLILGFIENESILEKVKRKPSTSLASYDIGLLMAWYKAVEEAYKSRPNLVVILHDFEQIDPIVMQDVFYICSMHIPRLPLVFILSLASPPSPSYLHAAYPRATLALLRIRNIVVPSGPKILEEILLKTFFDVEFEPDIMIGPTTIEWLADYFTRYNSSVDALITALQLAHLKHFTSDPLTALLYSTPPAQDLSNSFPFLDALLARLYAPDGDEASLPDPGDVWRSFSLASLVKSVDAARSDFYSRARKLRVGFGIMQLMQGFMKAQGYKGLDWGKDTTVCDLMEDVLSSKFERDIKYLGTLVRKFKPQELRSMLEELHAYFHAMSSFTVRFEQANARTQIVVLRNTLPKAGGGSAATAVTAASNISDWLVGYLKDLLSPLESSVLWDVWYTGMSPFPSELLNPSIRASMISGLLRPHEYPAGEDGVNETFPAAESLWEFPDTSILLKRYLDSGKMINVYDWFESFHSVLDTQKEQLKAASEKRTSPRKRVAEGKGKGKQKQQEADDSGDEEKWKVEVQARFMRALHELDYLGFIKHTGRKADHVMRTMFDIND